MTTEEKAKAYDGALEKARKYHAAAKSINDSSAARYENIFPELRESEDERIRNEILIYVGARQDIDLETHNRWCAYLEKQKEQKPKQKPKWLYRLEFKDKSCGLWYNGKGEWCFESGIGSLDDSCKTKTLPMDYDERYKADGRDWFSSCSRKEDLLHWYSKEDARILLRKGFVFTRYLATEYTEYEQQTVFIKETALYREEIDFFSLFDEQKPAEWSEEDEQFLLICKNALYKYQRTDQWDANIISKWLEERLKSLRPSWKPSEEQMCAFSRFITYCITQVHAGYYKQVDDIRLVEQVYKQLKKL